MLLDDITINSDLICLGDFSADAAMNKSVKGVLVYRHGKSYIKLFDYIPNKMQNAPIYGKLYDSDKKYIFAKFEGAYSDDSLRGSKYTLISTRMTTSDSDFNEKIDISYIKLSSPEISRLSEDIISKEASPVISDSIVEDENIQSCLSPETLSDTRNQLEIVEKKRVVFITKFRKFFDKEKFNSVYIDFMNLVSLFYGNSATVDYIVYGDSKGNIQRKYLDLNLAKSFERQSHLQLSWEKFIHDLGRIFKKVSVPRMHKLIESFCLSINGTLEPQIEILNYTNAIETYFKGQKYGNGKEIKSLNQKLLRIIKSVNKDNMFFRDETEEHDFCTSIRDTRDCLVHGDKSNSKYLLKDDKLAYYDDNLKRIIYYFILDKIGIATEVNIQSYIAQLNYHRLNY